MNGGIRALCLRRPQGKNGPYEVLSGGADGYVKVWSLNEVMGQRPDGTPNRGADVTASRVTTAQGADKPG